MMAEKENGLGMQSEPVVAIRKALAGAPWGDPPDLAWYIAAMLFMDGWLIVHKDEQSPHREQPD